MVDTLQCYSAGLLYATLLCSMSLDVNYWQYEITVATLVELQGAMCDLLVYY
jgi:hypothetical protein